MNPQIRGLIKVFNKALANVIHRKGWEKSDTNIKDNTKYIHQIEQIMHTAHRNLQNIERTSKEIISAYVPINSSDNRLVDAEVLGIDSTKFEENRKASTEHTSIKPTIRIHINNIAGVDRNKWKLETIINVMKSK
jgi:hypothetical protein